MTEPAKIVLIVHAIDTEGPLYESPEATFERLEELYGVSGLPKNKATIELLRKQEIELGGGLEEQVARTLSGHRQKHNETWDQVDEMLARVMAPDFRMSRPDSYGQGWVYNWFCIDLVGFVDNPRRRDLGYHNIFDHYREILSREPGTRDTLQFHFHPVSTYREAHRCATSFVNSPELYQVLCRRIIEKKWFPSAFRAGFQAERPDSHWFLEQWIPYDLSNMAMDDNSELDLMSDFRNGRSGNWRLAPTDWSVYHPHHDNYQLHGNCRRWIGRALNVLNRMASIDEREVEKAFKQANSGRPALIGIASHDYRDLGPEVEFIRDIVHKVGDRYPEVRFKYCDAVEAFRIATGASENEQEPLELTLTLNRNPTEDFPNLEINTVSGSVFGPQPFLAIETMSRRYIHDNLDFSTKPGQWFYAFHGDTLPFSDVRRIGVAANDPYGNTSVKVIDVNVP